MKPSNSLWKARIQEETMANNEGSVLQAAAWREREKQKQREKAPIAEGEFKNMTEIYQQCGSKQPIWIKYAWLAFVLTGTLLWKKQLSQTKKPCIFCRSAWGEHSLWNGKASSDKAFSRFYTPRALTAPSFQSFMFGLKVTSTLTLNNTNNYNKYLCLSSIHLCTLITKSFLCWPWRQRKMESFKK